jgi:hypothetical protein
MPYNFPEISDHDLKLFFAVINDLEHKANLMDATGPLKFNNTPKGVSKDEQMAILYRLDSDHYISFSNDGKSVWLNEKVYVGISWGDVFQSVHKAYHERFSKPKVEKKLKPHFDEINGNIDIPGYPPIKVIKHDEDTKQKQLLHHIFIINAKDIGREFDFTEFPFDDVEDKKKFKEICRTACSAINRKIAKETENKEKEFLKFNSRTYGWLKINPKYLQE